MQVARVNAQIIFTKQFADHKKLFLYRKQQASYVINDLYA